MPLRLSRRHLLRNAGALSASIALPLLPGCADAPDDGLLPLNVALAWINNVEYAGLWVAMERGYFATNGLRPQFLSGGPNAPLPTVSVAAGAAQIAFENEFRRFIDAVNNGNDLVILGTQYQISPGAVLSLPSHPIRKPEDLLGIRFLGQEGTQGNIDAVLRRAGLPLDYTFVPAGFTPDPLIEGAGEGYACFAVNQPITLQERYGMEEGRDYIVTPWADLGLPAYANTLFCERGYLDQNFDVAVNFLDATIRGWEANIADPDLGANLAVNVYGADLGLDLDQQRRHNVLQVPFMHSETTDREGLFWVSPEDLGGDIYAGLRASGRTNLPDPDRIIDTRPLEAVRARRQNQAEVAENA